MFANQKNQEKVMEPPQKSIKEAFPEVNSGVSPTTSTNSNYGAPLPTGTNTNYGAPPPTGTNGNFAVPPPPMVGYGQPQISGGQQSNVTVVVQQPCIQQNRLLVTGIKGSRDWSTGLFDCFSDIGVCLFTWCCYPCAICQLASRTGECFCTPFCVPASDISLRTRIRTLGGIQGSMCGDCLTVACCGPCAACQESRELSNMGIV